MPLIVGGDFTWPNKVNVKIDGLVKALSPSPLVLNLEGAFIEGDPAVATVVDDFKLNLFSVDEAIDVLRRLNVVSLGLANNHIGDYKGACQMSLDILKRTGFSYFGLQRHPFTDVVVENTSYRFVGVVSPLTEFTEDKDGLTANPFDPDTMLRQVGEWRKRSPELKIVVFVHWGYELSRFPLPADRAWAHKAIASGADFVIGHHPHVVQGIERVGKGVVAYSLGNFVLPQVKYRDKHLSYSDPAVAKQLAITLEDDPDLVWLRYEVSDRSIVADGRERLSVSARIAELTPFAGMSEREYRRWFRQARSTGRVNIKRSLVVLWSYSGAWKLHLLCAFLFLNLRRTLRAVLIRVGIHHPYNWGSK